MEKKPDEIWVVGSLARAQAEPDFGPHVTLVVTVTPNHTMYRMVGGVLTITGYRKARTESIETADCSRHLIKYDPSFNSKCPLCVYDKPVVTSA